MELPALIDALSQPAAYPSLSSNVEVVQTHISVVFLAGDFVYKVKKPVRLSFLDFSTLELRRKYCEQEVRLNRRLAPDVYLDVVPITFQGGHLRFEGKGEVVEWAVKMRRLPHEATLESLVESGRIDSGQIEKLAERLAGFHAAAESSPHISSFGRFESVARNIRENFIVAEPMVGRTISVAVRNRLHDLTERALTERQNLMEARSARGVPRDTHGDLHLDHVYFFSGQAAPRDLVIVDCIEFNERFRYTDPIADMAFLAMDLQFHGRWDLADAFCETYFNCSGDDEGRTLLPLYISYRAAVRGKVDGLQLSEPEIPEAARAAALVRAHGHWLLSLCSLEAPPRRPCVILVGGLPGTGKSSVAKRLADRAGFHVIRTDVVRKELAGLSSTTPSPAAIESGLYTPEWTVRTYAECRARAERSLFDGERVLIDATFMEEQHRGGFLRLARDWGVHGLMFVCDAPPAIVRARLAARTGDASDADWSVYQSVARRWEKPRPETVGRVNLLDTGASTESAVEQALAVLHEWQLA